MKFDANTVIRFLMTGVGFWIMFKGLAICFFKNELYFLSGGFWRALMGAVFALLGLFVVYFSDFYPPLTAILEPVIFFFMDLPQRLGSFVKETKPLRL